MTDSHELTDLDRLTDLAPKPVAELTKADLEEILGQTAADWPEENIWTDYVGRGFSRRSCVGLVVTEPVLLRFFLRCRAGRQGALRQRGFEHHLVLPGLAARRLRHPARGPVV